MDLLNTDEILEEYHMPEYEPLLFRFRHILHDSHDLFFYGRGMSPNWFRGVIGRLQEYVINRKF